MARRTLTVRVHRQRCRFHYPCPVSTTESGDPAGDAHSAEVDASSPAAQPTGESHDLSLKTQIVRFIITGGLSGVVDFGLTVLLMHFGLSHTPAKAIGFVCGTTTAYLLNRRWTFQASPSAARFVAVAVLYAITFSVQVGLFDVMYGVLPEGILYTFIAYCVGQGTATVINFIVQRVVIFRLREEKGPEHPVRVDVD